MNELQVKIDQTPGLINFNFEELKTQLEGKMAEYQGAVFTEESKQSARGELASLRNLRKSVDERRKEVKRLSMEPYTKFEEQVKELLEIIDRPIALIDKQLKEMEAERVRKRRECVRDLYNNTVPVEAERYLPFDAVYDPKWDLAGTTLKKTQEDLERMVTKAGEDVMAIRNSQSDAAAEALEIYKNSRDLNQAFAYINTYEANKRRALEKERERREAEEERRIQAEIERAREAEREKLAEIEKARKEERRKAEALANAAREPEIPFCVEDEGDVLPFQQTDTVTAFYKVVATPEELDQVEMAFCSFGIIFERRDG